MNAPRLRCLSDRCRHLADGALKAVVFAWVDVVSERATTPLVALSLQGITNHLRRDGIRVDVDTVGCLVARCRPGFLGANERVLFGMRPRLERRAWVHLLRGTPLSELPIHGAGIDGYRALRRALIRRSAP